MKLLIITQKVDLADPVLGFFHRWIEKFAEHFEKIEVIALEVGEYALPANVSIHSLGKDKKYNKFYQFLNLQFAICNLQYNCVFVHMNPEYLALFGWYWKLTSKCTALWYTHKSVTWWLRAAEKQADKIFTASRESFRLPSKKVEVVGHGIDMELFQISNFKFQNDEGRLLFVGRISPSKDIETILLALKKLIDEGTRFSLDIVGTPVMGADFSYEKVIKELVQKLNLQEYVKFLGPKRYDELPDIYRSHDLLVHTSKTGSIDKVVLESLACGTPVLSSSEAFNNLLPENLRFRENNADDLAEKIRNFTQAQPNTSKLTELIRAHNDLNKLVKKISNYLTDQVH